jgi:hypothetical protein
MERVPDDGANGVTGLDVVNGSDAVGPPGATDADEPVSPDTGPTARRIILGAHLRRLREEAGVSRAQAGYLIRGSDSKMSRLESGKVGFKERDVADLLTAYGITDPAQREAITGMALRSNEHGWWQRFGDVIPTWFEDYVGLESSASRIQTYELLFVPGLLQTEDYARAVITGGRPATSTPATEQRIRLRMRRQQRLGRRDAPTVWAVLDEAVLHRPVGGPSVHLEQLRHLVELASLPNVIIQVLPNALSGYAAEGAFAVLRFAEPELPDLVYLESMTNALYLDKREEVETYSRAMDRLTVDALSPADTRQFLAKMHPGG